MLLHRDKFEITTPQLWQFIMHGNPRNQFWGMQNSLDGILEEENICYEEHPFKDLYIFRKKISQISDRREAERQLEKNAK